MPTYIPDCEVGVALVAWLSALPPRIEAEFIVALGKCDSILRAEPLRTASGCSGTDICAKLDERLWSTLNAKYGTALGAEHVVACENEPFKQRFLQWKHPQLGMLVANLKELAGQKARNVNSGVEEIVPFFNFLRISSTCSARAQLIPNVAGDISCVEEQCESTGIRFADALTVISAHWPRIVHLECVLGLLERKKMNGKPVGISDAEHIVAKFEAHGYWCVTAALEAKDFGSPLPRGRCWWVAIQGLQGEKRDIKDLFDQVLNSFKSLGDSLSLDEIIIDSDTHRQQCSLRVGVLVLKGTGRRTSDREAKEQPVSSSLKAHATPHWKSDHLT